MSALVVRVAEQADRPLGYAVITVDGVPHSLESMEFALSRHGYAANHLSPTGWQGAECWLQPEEAWYCGESLQFVLGPELVFQLESMPYELALRGQGLARSERVTFTWPVTLEVESTGGNERETVGGTRIHPEPRRRPPEPATSPVKPLPALNETRIEIPDLAIPEIELPPTTPPATTTSLPPTPSPESQPQNLPEPPPSQPQPQNLPEPSPPIPPPVSPEPSRVVIAATAAPSSSAPQVREATMVPEFSAPPLLLPPLEQPPARFRSTGIIGITLLVLLAVGLAGWWLWSKGGGKVAVIPEPSSGEASLHPVVAPPVTTAPLAPPPSQAVAPPTSVGTENRHQPAPPAMPSQAVVPETRPMPAAPASHASSPLVPTTPPQAAPAEPLQPPHRGKLESELESQFNSNSAKSKSPLETELESALQHKPAVTERKP